MKFLKYKIILQYWKKRGENGKQKENLAILLSAMILLLSLFYFILPATATETETLILNPIADTYISSEDPLSNFGGQERLEVSFNEYDIALTFLIFDLSKIPEEATITKALLQLYCSWVDETHHVEVYYIANNSWQEYELTWLNAPEGVTPRIEEKAADTQIVAKDSTWYNWTVTNLVKNVLNTTEQKITLVLQERDIHTGFAEVWFEPKDQDYSWMEEYIPKLQIEYTLPPPVEEQGEQPLPVADGEERGGAIGGVIFIVIVIVDVFLTYKLVKRKGRSTTSKIT